MVTQISPEETFPLRRAVLRKGMPNEPHEFKGDFEENTFHFGFKEGSELLGVVTVMVQGEEAQLRGMAVSENSHHRGIGSALLLAAEDFLKEKEVKSIWMNARETAVPFYAKFGYQIQGPLFMIAPIGWHCIMQKNLINIIN